MDVKLQNVAKHLVFSIAVIKECNYKCGYCYPFGQNKSHGINMSEKEFCSIIDAAYESGFIQFKISGGEPTLVKWLFPKIEEILNKYPDVEFTIITNGTHLKPYLAFLEKYRDKISIQFSLDSVSTIFKEGIYKKLDKDTCEILSTLSKNRIKTRINMVITKQTKDEINKMIKLVADFGFSMKLFNLFIQGEYIATNGVNGVIGKYSSLSPYEYFKENYVSYDEVMDKIKEKYVVEKVESSHEEGFGSVQTTIKIGNTKILVLNSSSGAFFNREICIKGCPLFGKSCEKGLFNPLVSSNMVLHIDDCNNSNYRWNLRGKSHEEMLKSIEEIVNLFNNIEFVNNPINNYHTKNKAT
jgi:molybdenum cofactor biosynthesis enzyme MoaA